MAVDILQRFDQGLIEDWDAEKDAVWEAIPGKKENVSGVLKKMNDWAIQHRLLEKAPEWVKDVSYCFYEVTGVVPGGSGQTWVRQMMDLWQASGKSTSVLTKGLWDAKQSGKRLPFPRSYIGFVKNRRSLEEKREEAQPE